MALSNPILILLILVTARCAVAQPSPSSLTGDDKDLYGQNFNAATAILIVVIVSAFFFLAFFSVYFRRCSRDRSAVVPAAGAAAAASHRGARRGLDPAVVETFPTLPYSAVTGLKIGKETLECAVCLSEFSDDETLRMLPKCCHVFHPECIDTWLASHVTCPVCRDNLSVAPADLEAGPEIPEPEETDGAGNSISNSVDVAADSGVNRKMGRSYTVGHVSEGVDRFTLRLPEHVRREIVAAGSLRRSASVAVFGGGGGEGNTRRGYRGRSGMWAGLSDRWASGILARVSTWRRGEGEGSVRRGDQVAEGSMSGGMFDCLGGGGGDRGESSSSAVDDEEAPMKVFSRS